MKKKNIKIFLTVKYPPPKGIQSQNNSKQKRPKPFKKLRVENKNKKKKISKRPINEVKNLVNILSKLLRNAFYSFNWLILALPGQN